MKKFLILSIIAISSVLPVLAEVEIPKWSEFCPPQYLNAPSATFNVEKNYWHNRHAQFETAVEGCRRYTGEERDACYTDIRDLEKLKNEIRIERQQNTVQNPSSGNSNIIDTDTTEFGTTDIQTTVE